MKKGVLKLFAEEKILDSRMVMELGNLLNFEDICLKVISTIVDKSVALELDLDLLVKDDEKVFFCFAFEAASVSMEIELKKFSESISNLIRVNYIENGCRILKKIIKIFDFCKANTPYFVVVKLLKNSVVFKLIQKKDNVWANFSVGYVLFSK